MSIHLRGLLQYMTYCCHLSHDTLRHILYDFQSAIYQHVAHCRKLRKQGNTMARPTTKQELITAAEGQFDKLWNLYGSMTEAEQNIPLNYSPDFHGKEAHWARDKNFRDVFIHLYEWHQLLLNWVSANQNGESKAFLPAPYNWKNYAKMNESFWEKHQDTPLSDSMDLLKKSHADVMALIESFTDEALFVKKYFPWVGSTSLGSYCISATASHYDWAMKKMKQHLKALR